MIDVCLEGNEWFYNQVLSPVMSAHFEHEAKSQSHGQVIPNLYEPLSQQAAVELWNASFRAFYAYDMDDVCEAIVRHELSRMSAHASGQTHIKLRLDPADTDMHQSLVSIMHNSVVDSSIFGPDRYMLPWLFKLTALLPLATIAPYQYARSKYSNALFTFKESALA